MSCIWKLLELFLNDTPCLHGKCIKKWSDVSVCYGRDGPGALQRLQTVISEYHPLISSHKIIPKPPLYIEEIVRLNLHCQEMEVLP